LWENRNLKELEQKEHETHDPFYLDIRGLMPNNKIKKINDPFSSQIIRNFILIPTLYKSTSNFFNNINLSISNSLYFQLSMTFGHLICL
jgi:hypothetical protein